MKDNKVLLSPIEQLIDLIRSVIREELSRKHDEDRESKFLSPRETCRLFVPEISIPTLASYEKKSLLKKYRMGRHTFYKYGEVMEAVKRIKRNAKNEPESELAE